MLGVEHTRETVEFYPAQDHKASWFTKINPLGTLPVLIDNELTLKDSAAILVYLASRYAKNTDWHPSDNPARLAQVIEWLSFADQLTGSVSQARLAEGFFYQIDAQACRIKAHQLFRILDEHLWFAEQQNHNWLVEGDKPTIADIACFPYVILSEEGSIMRQDYPAIRRWTDRVKRLPGFTVMPGVFPAGPAL